jgi:hypothetical protein
MENLMKKIIIGIIAATLAFTGCKKEQTTPAVVDNGNPKVTITEAVGYGDTEESAIQDARHDAIFRGFGTIEDSSGTMKMVANGTCLSDSIIEKSQDEVKMWTVKIKAVVQKNK